MNSFFLSFAAVNVVGWSLDLEWLECECRMYDSLSSLQSWLMIDLIGLTYYLALVVVVVVMVCFVLFVCFMEETTTEDWTSSERLTYLDYLISMQRDGRLQSSDLRFSLEPKVTGNSWDQNNSKDEETDQDHDFLLQRDKEKRKGWSLVIVWILPPISSHHIHFLNLHNQFQFPTGSWPFFKKLIK